MSTKTLKIAVQKSGRLFEDSLRILKDCGISVDNGRDQLKVKARNFPLEIMYLRNGDIPQYLKDGVVEIGILGEKLIYEKDGMRGTHEVKTSDIANGLYFVKIEQSGEVFMERMVKL